MSIARFLGSSSCLPSCGWPLPGSWVPHPFVSLRVGGLCQIQCSLSPFVSLCLPLSPFVSFCLPSGLFGVFGGVIFVTVLRACFFSACLQGQYRPSHLEMLFSPTHDARGHRTKRLLTTRQSNAQERKSIQPQKGCFEGSCGYTMLDTRPQTPHADGTRIHVPLCIRGNHGGWVGNENSGRATAQLGPQQLQQHKHVPTSSFTQTPTQPTH